MVHGLKTVGFYYDFFTVENQTVQQKQVKAILIVN